MQHIETDSNDRRIWDVASSRLLNVQLINSHDFYAITGHRPPSTPVDAATYIDNGVPWDAAYGEDAHLSESRGERKIEEAWDATNRSEKWAQICTDPDSGKESLGGGSRHAKGADLEDLQDRIRTRVAMLNVDGTVPKFKT